MSSERLLKPAGVALLFALSGACSASLMNPWSSPAEEGNYLLLVPLPFAFLSFFLFHPTKPAGLLGFPLNVLAWLIAYLTVGFVMGNTGDPLIGVCVGGAIGGLSVTLCAATGQRRLLSSKYLISATAIGAVLALSFVFSARGEDTRLLLGRRCAFAIWQAAVGTYLYVVCTQLKTGKGDRPVF
jgi:hypothetical protein